MKKQKRGRKIIRRKTDKSLRNRYVQVSDFLIESRFYVIFTLILFALVSIIGYAFPVFFVEQIITLLTNLEKDLTLMINRFGIFGAVGFIMGNNIMSSAIAVVFGFFLGIPPIISIFTNSYLLGFVSRFAVEQKGIFILWRLLPHGIFEFPAIIISIVLGIRLGTFYIFEKKRTFIGDLGYVFKNCLWTFLLVVLPLLIIAGIIEGILIFVAG